ncbi:MAG TPA: class I SAM-dependent methyltransferase [Candidatus Dormibacteraeota bacterium]|jgi:cyclopropane-fatty-acyl-phospholipid synthase|nr:class I SAM-dependent methyltransferase [Candidatus Dormibacteraeota bacterium]
MAQVRERRDEHQLYHAYSIEEDQARTNVHYEQPKEFFYGFTGGEWNVYSCNLWEEGFDDTRAQEAKLDLMASLAGLRPGMRVLDVGCGWGGPLTYLCRRYDLCGVGLNLSPTQKLAADERIARHGVDAVVHTRHWAEFEDPEPFDAIVTDEVIVHFNDLGGFFRKAHSLLRDGGRMVNKELHLSHPRHALLERGGEFVSAIYGDTGNYRTLAEELALTYDAGFDNEIVRHIPRRHYETTIDHWLANMFQNRESMVAASGEEHWRRFRIYLRLARRIQQNMTLDIVASRKIA